MTHLSAGQLAALHQAAFAPTRGWSEDEISALLARPSAKLVGDDTGFALADLVSDEGELLTICIAPAKQGHGHGYRLLQALHERLSAEGCRRIVLEVAADNHAAQALYNKCGYHEIARRKDYYRRENGREDALVLSLSL